MRSIIGLSFVFLGACGVVPGSDFDDSKKAEPDTSSPAGFSSGPTGTGDSCVKALSGAELEPVDLVFMYDRSGSMGDTRDGFDPAVKWDPVARGMKAFFEDPASHTLNASLKFFPLPEGDLAAICDHDYGAPDVPLASLSDATSFVSAIDKERPGGGTPTLPALRGAIAYAKKVATDRHEKAAVVLVTDGEPGFGINGIFQPGCEDNTVDSVAETARAAHQETPSIATHVIGVGPSLSKLDAIAAAGGTGKAYMIDVAAPATTKQKLLDALRAIRGETVSCDLTMPPAPNGMVLNPNAVNVVFTSGMGKETVLTYSKDCSDVNGWHYDDPAAPKRIQLCSQTCGGAQSDKAARLSIAFGCFTRGGVR